MENDGEFTGETMKTTMALLEANAVLGDKIAQSLLEQLRQARDAVETLHRVAGGVSAVVASLVTTPPDIFYFGCSAGSAGHYWHHGSGRIYREVQSRLPVSIDGVYAPRKDREERPQGHCRTVILGDDETGYWTVVAWWDRSEDKRGACNSAFAARGVHAFSHMAAAGREQYPWVFKRMAFPLINEQHR